MRAIFDLAAKQKRLAALTKESYSEDFWADPAKAKSLNQELARLKDEVAGWQALAAEVKELPDLVKLLEQSDETAQEHAALAKEIEDRAAALEKRLHQQEMKTFLGGPYDAGHAIMSIMSGAGGVDAQDWAKMLLEMYRRYAANHSFKATLFNESYGEQGGLKEVTLKIEGAYAYGFLKAEQGVHRLVRISPFSAQSLRHTSFALVEVLPELPAAAEIELNPADLAISTFRSSGPGGQYVNKTESAVRVVHWPTGLSAVAQSERSQQQNRALALGLLKARLVARLEQERKKRLEELKEKVKPEWGAQIRSYVLHPYKLVKDHRTNVESSAVEAVLNGELDMFIEAALKVKT